MSRVALVLNSLRARAQAIRWIETAVPGTRLEFKEPKRSIPQNDRMWASLTDIAAQVTHHGIKLSPDDWKLLFLDALKREVRMVPNLDSNGFVSLGRSSSDLSKAEFSDLLELIYAYGAKHQVKFHDGQEPSGGQEPRSEAA